MNLASFVEKSAGRIPDHTALRFEGRAYTYSTLNQKINRVANGLASMGLKEGDTCVLMMQSSAAFIITYYALAKIGTVVVPVNFLYKRHELAHIFKDSEACAFIGMAPYLEEPAKVMKELPEIKLRLAVGVGKDSSIYQWEDLDGSINFSTADMAADDVSTIIYTSGTTGAPKGAMLTHDNLIYNATTVAEMRRTQPNTVIIGVLPLYHIFGQTSVLNSAMHLGLTLHLHRQFEPLEVLDIIEKEDNTVLFAVPTMLNRLLTEVEHNGLKRSSLIFFGSGGASLPAAMLEKIESVFGARVYEGYGLSECSPGCIAIPFGSPARPGSTGKPIPGVEARIVDENDIDIPQGEVGELIVKSPGVMKGYKNLPDETAHTLRGGWMHTGDLARQDADGYYYIVDRKKDMIIRGGYNVYPREIEELLYQHPDVVEAAVYGTHHPDLGEEIVADVVPFEGAKITEAEIRDFIKSQVAPYKYPRIIRLVMELPKSHTGKILKRELRDRMAG